MADDLMSREEVAALLDIDVEAVRSTLSRRGIKERRGYPRKQVIALAAERERQKDH